MGRTELTLVLAKALYVASILEDLYLQLVIVLMRIAVCEPTKQRRHQVDIRKT